jgi:hypothetical protein
MNVLRNEIGRRVLHMTDNEFNGLFDRMVRNWSSETSFWDDELRENKREDFWKRFRYIRQTVFEKAVIDIIEAERKKDAFPTEGEVRRYVKLNDTTIKEYPKCLACNTSGTVSMILAFNLDEDGARTIAEKHYWTVGKKAELYRDNPNNHRYYDYAFTCRCDKGWAVHNGWDRKAYQLSHDEYNELLEEAAKQKNDKRVLVAT